MQSCQENLTKFSSGAVDESQKLFSCGWSKDKILGRRPNHSVNLSRTNNIFPLPSVFSRIFPPSAETQKATFSKQQYKFNGIVLHDFFFLPLEREKDDSRLMSCHSSYGIILISVLLIFLYLVQKIINCLFPFWKVHAFFTQTVNQVQNSRKALSNVMLGLVNQRKLHFYLLRLWNFQPSMKKVRFFATVTTYCISFANIPKTQQNVLENPQKITRSLNFQHNGKTRF